MDDLVRWLEEQFAEDERIARATHPTFLAWEYDECVRQIRDMGNGNELANVLPRHAYGEHMTEHDPARVLREIDAKRATIREYEKALRMRDELVPNTSGYRHWDNRSFGLYVALRHTAAVYAHRPGYAEALAAEKSALLADE